MIWKDADIFPVLEAAMERNTRHYQSDFQYDRELILQAAAHPKQYLLWLSRPCGTECFYERDVYIKESYAHHAWVYHAEKRGPCIAYAVEITGLRDGRPVGNLYPLDLQRHAARIKREALSAQTVTLIFSDGAEVCCGYADRNQNQIARRGEVVGELLHPEDEHTLDAILHNARADRQSKRRRNLSHES